MITKSLDLYELIKDIPKEALPTYLNYYESIAHFCIGDSNQIDAVNRIDVEVAIAMCVQSFSNWIVSRGWELLIWRVPGKRISLDIYKFTLSRIVQQHETYIEDDLIECLIFAIKFIKEQQNPTKWCSFCRHSINFKDPKFIIRDKDFLHINCAEQVLNNIHHLEFEAAIEQTRWIAK